MQQNEMKTAAQGRGAACGMSMGSVGVLLGGVGVGAALMYLFDPERGRTRRARLSDQMVSQCHRLSDRTAARARDLRNRAQGVMHEAGALFRSRGRAEGGGDGRANQHALGAQAQAPAPAQGM